MFKMIKLFEGLHAVLWSFPRSTAMSNAKKFIRVNQVIERLVCVLHAFMKDVGEEKKEEGDGNVSAWDDEDKPLKFHDQKN